MTSADFISSHKTDSPGLGSMSVTPSNTDDLTDANGTVRIARSLYVQDAGTVSFIGVDGQTDTWTVPDFFTIRVAVKRVLAAGTSSTEIKAIW